MKNKILYLSTMILLLVFAGNFAFSASTVFTSTGKCEDLSKISAWTTNIVFNEKGRPTGISGVDCNGKVWAKNFEIPSEDASTLSNLNVWIKSMDNNTLTLQSNGNYDFQIINTQTGEWVTSLDKVNSSKTPKLINLSNLPNGNYAVVSFDNSEAINFLQFIK